MSLRRADRSSRGVLPTVVHRCVWSRNLVKEEALAHWGTVAPKINWFTKRRKFNKNNTDYYRVMKCDLLTIYIRLYVTIFRNSLLLPYSGSSKKTTSLAKFTQTRLILGFYLDVDEICALLRYFAAWSGDPAPTFRDNLLIPSSRVKMGPISCPEASLPNHNSTQRNISVQRRYQQRYWLKFGPHMRRFCGVCVPHIIWNLCQEFGVLIKA
jgi:hypothetical protein